MHLPPQTGGQRRKAMARFGGQKKEMEHGVSML